MRMLKGMRGRAWMAFRKHPREAHIDQREGDGRAVPFLLHEEYAPTRWHEEYAPTRWHERQRVDPMAWMRMRRRDDDTIATTP